MVERVKSHRRAVRDGTGKVTEIENAVKAANITGAGDLAEVAASAEGVALFVANDGTVRRCTLAAVVAYLQGRLQGEPGEDGKSSYQYAVDGGYTGTEAEFKALMADAASKTYVADAIQTAMLKVVSGTLGAVEVSLDCEVGTSGSPVTMKFTGTAERVGTIGTDDLVLVNASLTFAATGETINTVMVSLPAWYVAPDGTWSELSTYEQMKVTIGTESYSLSPKDTATPRTYYTGDSYMDVFAGFTGDITVTVTGYVRVKRQTSAG